MRKFINRIAGDAERLNACKCQRDIKAIRRLIASRVYGIGDSINEASQPRLRESAIDDLEEEEARAVEMIVSASQDSLNVALFNGVQDAMELLMHDELAEGSRQSVAKFQVAQNVLDRMIAVWSIKEICRLKLLDHMVFEGLNVEGSLPQHEPCGRKTFGVAPYRVQVWRIGEVINVARPASIVVSEKDYMLAAVYQDPSRRVDCRNRVELTKQEDVVGQGVGNEEPQPDHEGAKPAALDRRESTHMVLPAKIQILVCHRGVGLVAARRYRSRALATLLYPGHHKEKRYKQREDHAWDEAD